MNGRPRRRAETPRASARSGSPNVDAAVRALHDALALQGSPARAAHEKAYLRSRLDFLGTAVPAIRREARTFVRAHADTGRLPLKRLVDALWRQRVHELRSVAIAVLELQHECLRGVDAGWLCRLAADSGTWAHVDWIATKVIGALVAREPPLAARLVRWSRDPDVWVRRTALLALHDPLLAGGGDFVLFERLAVPLLGDREFFIRKAIGWVLRSTAARSPTRTIGFVHRHAAAMSALTFREAIRTLEPGEQRRLQTVRDAALAVPRGRATRTQ